MPMRDPQAVERGRQLRQSMTPPEIKLWYRLRNRQLDGLKFRRQASVGPYIADFLSHDAKIAIELDGDTHATGQAAVHDERRTRFSEEQGFRVVRFFNSEVCEDLDYVVERIRLACGLRPAAES
jgi:very-short-patch-repair endonuclease